MSDTSAIVQRLGFGTGTCPRHREMFVRVLVAKDVLDWRAMEYIRMRVIVAATRQLSDEDVRGYLTDRCVGCEREEWIVDLVEQVADEEVAWALRGAPIG